MSDKMLMAVLRMPPDCWLNDELDKAQRYARYLEAANRIEELETLCSDWKEEANYQRDKNEL